MLQSSYNILPLKMKSILTDFLYPQVLNYSTVNDEGLLFKIEIHNLNKYTIVKLTLLFKLTQDNFIKLNNYLIT